jgi:DNA polymerase-3 subunit gamma/tau
MFYTKYRPQTFSEISKPNDVATALANQVKSKKVGHAYLFVGPRGTGKTTTARILAKALNCEKISKTGDPCDSCDICEAVKIGNYLDLIEIDAASNRGIDDIRDLRDKIKLAPSLGKQKIYIIDEVHMLTAEAFNALLKTLEEPPAHATFVLCTTEDHKVPDTIKSRCQVFKFKRATVAQIVEKLEGICESEKIKTKVKKEDLEKIAKASFGGFRDAETLLQQIVEGELDVDSFVGVSSKQEFIDFVTSLSEKNSKEALRHVNKLYEDGVELHTWSLELLKYLRDLLFIATDAHEGLVDVPKNIFVSMEAQASKLDPGEVVAMLVEFSTAANAIKGSPISQLPLEIGIVKLCEGPVTRVNPIEEEPKDSGSPGLPAGGGDKKAPPSKKPRKKSSSDLNTKFNDIQDAWSDILKGVIQHNHGVQALLKATRPTHISGNALVLEVFYKFHKERLESPKNRRIVELVLADMFGEDIVLTCILSDDKPAPKTKHESGELTDLNVGIPAAGESLLDVFDGALPL